MTCQTRVKGEHGTTYCDSSDRQDSYEQAKLVKNLHVLS